MLGFLSISTMSGNGRKAWKTAGPISPYAASQVSAGSAYARWRVFQPAPLLGT